MGCTPAEASAAEHFLSPSLLSPSSGSGMYSMQSTGANSGKDLTVRGAGRFRDKISTWPPAPSCPPPTWGRDPERPSGENHESRGRAQPLPPRDPSQTSTCHWG